ncbi:MAG: hypothetical protein GPJ54_09395 [Candidatus Heimdallarchaeota archaeon]|nr:hypothetical protein [Candidatus Heimdallarchaeota archaeon]
MTRSASNEAKDYRRKALYKSINHVKKINTEKRMKIFLDLQQSMQESYWTGLKDRYPTASETELKEIALKEAKSRVKHRKLVSKTL